MAEEKKEQETPETAVAAQPDPQQDPQPEAEQTAAKKKNRKADKKDAEIEALKAQLAGEKDNYLRLAAEYDNFRKRSQKEKDHIYNEGVSDTLTKLLPIYDNLERAIQQATADEAYKKGVEMIMNSMKEMLDKCGVTVFGARGESFDPTLHNAVMHGEDESLGENQIAEVFQKGFRIGEKVVRFAMVRVAN